MTSRAGKPPRRSSGTANGPLLLKGGADARGGGLLRAGFPRRFLLGLLVLGRRRLLAVLGPVQAGELGLQLRMVHEALAVRPIVLRAPVPLLLALGRVLRVTQAADFL